MNRDNQIEKLAKELSEDINQELSPLDKVKLLKAFMLDRRQGEKNELELMKFRFIEEHRKMLLQNDTPGPHWMDGPQGLGRRLLACDAEKTINNDSDSRKS